MAKRTCSIDGCDRAHYGRGWCRNHYTLWLRRGNPSAPAQRAPNGASAEQRLRRVGWTTILRRPDLGPCWEWNGRTDRYGYGRMGGELAHRLAYRTWVGPLDDDVMACHRCDNPPCLAPNHLFPGDGVTNAADMVGKGRSRNGERHPDVKLTDSDVAAIRAAYTGARGQQTRLAEQYGVNPKTISRIVRGTERTHPTTHPSMRI